MVTMETIACSSNCLGRRCDINSGHCLSCLRGYQGPRCTQGINLEKKCCGFVLDQSLSVVS